MEFFIVVLGLVFLISVGMASVVLIKVLRLSRSVNANRGLDNKMSTKSSVAD